jgi:hypothetical protein
VSYPLWLPYYFGACSKRRSAAAGANIDSLDEGTLRSRPERRTYAALRFGEFVVLAAAVMSTQGIAIDAMLSALPSILGELHVAHQNDGQ